MSIYREISDSIYDMHVAEDWPYMIYMTYEVFRKLHKDKCRISPIETEQYYSIEGTRIQIIQELSPMKYLILSRGDYNTLQAAMHHLVSISKPYFMLATCSFEYFFSKKLKEIYAYQYVEIQVKKTVLNISPLDVDHEITSIKMHNLHT